MKVAVLCVALMLCLPAAAGEINVSWDPSTGAAGYRLYSGTEPGTYGPPLEVTGTASPLTTLVDGCVQQYVTVTAFNIAGESGFSQELTVFPRPVFLVPPYLDESGPQPVIAIDGGNFAPGITLTINNVAVGFVVQDCERIDVAVLGLPTPVQGQPMSFQLCNGSVCQQSAIPVMQIVTGIAAN